jgi:ribosomal protein L37AE/L43A
VSEIEYECDFCERKFPHLYPINDGMWAICHACMELEYGDCHPPEYCVYKTCECEEE